MRVLGGRLHVILSEAKEAILRHASFASLRMTRVLRMTRARAS